MSAIGTTSCIHDATYGSVKVTINRNEKGLFIEIETQRLRILSVNTNQFEPQLTSLYGDKEVNRLVGSGGTLNGDLVSQKIKRWTERWKGHNPLSGYVVLEKESNDFVGQIILKPVKDKSSNQPSFLPNLIEIGYLSAEKHWRKGYGKEYTHAIVNHLVPVLIEQKFQVHQTPIEKIMATARCDNEGSNKILNLFMNFIEEKERYGGPRMWYQYNYFEKGTKNETI